MKLKCTRTPLIRYIQHDPVMVCCGYEVVPHTRNDAISKSGHYSTLLMKDLAKLFMTSMYAGVQDSAINWPGRRANSTIATLRSVATVEFAHSSLHTPVCMQCANPSSQNRHKRCSRWGWRLLLKDFRTEICFAVLCCGVYGFGKTYRGQGPL